MFCLAFLSTCLVVAGSVFAAASAAAPLAQTANVYALPEGVAATPLHHVPTYSMPFQVSDREARTSFSTTSKNIPRVVSASQPGGAPLEMMRQSPSEYSYTVPGAQHQQRANPMYSGVIYEQDAFSPDDKSRHRTQYNQALVERTNRADLGRGVPEPSSSEFGSWPTGADRLTQTLQRLPDDREHTGSTARLRFPPAGGPNPYRQNGRDEPEKSSQSSGTSLRHSWLFSSTREKLHDAVEFMKNTGGDFQFPAPMDVEPPGYLAAQISHKKPEQAYPHVVRAGETDLPERGDVARPVSDIPGQLSGSETSMAGNMTFPQHNVYVYGNSLTSSADIWNVPGPNTSAPSIYMASVSQPFVSDNPLPSVRGANLAFPLAARAYQFMVPRAELLLASSRYAEEYLDLVAALYCLFQKWPCNNMEEFAEQTRRHQANAATSTPSRPGGGSTS